MLKRRAGVAAAASIYCLTFLEGPQPQLFAHAMEGLDGLDGLFKSETNCPAFGGFTCPEGQIPMQTAAGTSKKNWPFVYGCDASSFDMMMMLDPSQLNGGMP